MSDIRYLWDKHRKEFWDCIFNEIECEDESFQRSIMFWGVVKLSTFQDSIFFSNCKIICDNPNVHVYFITRMLSDNKMRHYFFLNTYTNKNRILSTLPINQEEGFLKILYEKNISFSRTFAHRMSWNCWLAIIEMEEKNRMDE
jgi:hypothetical protein